MNVKNRLVEVKGPKGTLTQLIPDGISVVVKDGEIVVHRRDDSKAQRAYHGLVRSLVNNMVTGVSEGFKKQLDLIGIGYKAEVNGNTLVMNLGYSHLVEMPMPDGVNVQIEKEKKKFSGFIATITVEGIDRQAVGQVAADIRAKRPPDSYKGKGLRYVGEVIRLKEGKKTA
jgi:large subunit ribosomal protein L6